VNKRYMTSAIVAVFGIIALACGSGGSEPSSDSPEENATDVGAEESSALSLGDTADNGRVRVTVDNLEFGVASNNQFEVAENSEDQTFTTVDVTIEVTGGDMMVATTDWQFTAGDGTTVTAKVIFSGIDGVLEFQTLSGGQKTSGKVVFDANPEVFDDGQATVIYKPFMMDPIVWNA
jgi:hypothetical protein